MDSDKSERLREIAELTVERNCAECAKSGSLSIVWKELNKVKDIASELQLSQARTDAVFGFWKWGIPVAITLGMGLAGILAPRIWPVHSAPVAVQQQAQVTP